MLATLKCTQKIISWSAEVMRFFHKFERESLLKLVERENTSLEDELDITQIKAAHENLRKNVIFYFNNSIQFMPSDSPKSVYINLRLEKENVIDIVQGNFYLYLCHSKIIQYIKFIQEIYLRIVGFNVTSFLYQN